MNNRNFKSISELLEHKKTLTLSSEFIFPQYLKSIYSNLIQREEFVHHSYSIKLPRNSIRLKSNNIVAPIKNPLIRRLPPPRTKLIDKGLSLKTFLEYLDLQEFIGERIYKYINKSNSIKLNKNDFCEGLNEIYYGNVKNLIKFTFYLADFDDDGMMYKTDMKLLLAYIPSTSEISQKLNLMQINQIVDTFFNQNIDNPQEGEEKQINYDTFLKYIEEYSEKTNNLKEVSQFLEDYNNNAPFFYYISILSYLFKNCPFNVKNVDYFIYSKKKAKLILRNDKKSLSQKKILSTAIKKNLNSSTIVNNNNTNNKIDNSSIGAFTIEQNKKKSLIETLPKIGQNNLFKVKKSSSQINIKRNNFANLSAIKSQKHDFMANKKETKITNIFSIKTKESMKIYNRNSKIKKAFSPVNYGKSSSQNLSPLINNPNSSINKLSASPELVQKNNIFNSCYSNETNGSSNHSGSNNNLMKFNSNNILPFIPSSKEKMKMTPLSVGTKLKEEKDENDEPGDFVLCEYSGSEDESGNINKINLNNIDNNNEENNLNSNEVYLYKINEEDSNLNQNSLNKYYAKLSDKEILFFSSELKNELCDLWFIYNSYISTGKEYLSNNNYFTINITFNNNLVNKLYFLNEKICENFSKKIKESIKSYDFEEHYDLMETLGHGHFGKVSKCRNKTNGQIFAVKIINKLEIKVVDLELIQQEKNFLKLIKHKNILSLKDYFEDRKNIYIITECCNGGDLLSFIDNSNKEKIPITEKIAAKITKKIAEGIRYLNFFGIIHRDIKPENIMFVKKNAIKTLKIIDLGVSQTLTYGETTNEPIGTNGYICPEIYLHHNYSFKIDIWSLGIILYLMITGGILPFDDDNMDSKIIGKKVVYLQQEYPEKYFGKKSKGLINLLDKMLEKNDNKRININDLIEDSWFGIIKK